MISWQRSFRLFFSPVFKKLPCKMIVEWTHSAYGSAGIIIVSPKVSAAVTLQQKTSFNLYNKLRHFATCLLYFIMYIPYCKFYCHRTNVYCSLHVFQPCPSFYGEILQLLLLCENKTTWLFILLKIIRKSTWVLSCVSNSSHPPPTRAPRRPRLWNTAFSSSSWCVEIPVSVCTVLKAAGVAQSV